MLTCIREGCTIAEAGLRLEANAERHLKSPAEMARLFAKFPARVERSVEIADRINFDLRQLATNIPTSRCRRARPPIHHLRRAGLARRAAWRFADGRRQKERRTHQATSST